MNATELTAEIDRRGLSLREAGIWCGVSRTYLCKLKRGHAPITDERATLIRLGLQAYDRARTVRNDGSARDGR